MYNWYRQALTAVTKSVQIGISSIGRSPWWLRLVVGGCVSVVLGHLALKALDWDIMLATLRDFPIAYALPGVIAYLGSLVFRALRWYVLFTKDQVSLYTLALVQNAGTGVNNMLPVRILSEPIQIALLNKRHGISTPTALATLATEHILDIIATALLMGIGVIFLPQLRGLSIQISGSLILGVVSLGAVFFVVKGVPNFPVVGRIHAFERWTSAISTLGRERARLLASFACTIVHWLLLGLAGWILAQGMGIEVELGAIVVMLLAAALFINSLPSAPGAAGTFEFAIIYTLDFFDVPRSEAVPFALVLHFIIFGPPILVAMTVFSREGLALLSNKRGQSNYPVHR